MDVKVRNPRTGEMDFSFVAASERTVSEVCVRLREAQPGWAALTPSERAKQLTRWKESLQSHRDCIVDALFRDTGRMNESVMEFDSLCQSIDRWCNDAPEWLSADTGRQTSIPFLSISRQDVAIPLVGVISPWNFPLLLSLIDAIPALMVGCSVVIKPSEITPRFIEPLLASLKPVPALSAVLNIVTGAGATGAALVENVDTICFTGSVATGRKVGEAAARAFIPAFLELGGKDPALVLEGADIDRAAAAIAWGGLANAGQSCLSIERVYVHESLFDVFVEKLVERVRALRFCAGQDSTDGEIGPVIAKRQADLLQAHLDDALEHGATALCGGQIKTIGGGLWCQPTVLTQVDHSSKVVREESFGPLLPVMAFSSDDEAVRLANDTPFGLSAAVFCDDAERARTVAERLDAGAVSINDCALTAIMHEGEKQAFKLSGMGGSRMGVISLRRFVRRKALLENTGGGWDPWWFHSS